MLLPFTSSSPSPPAYDQLTSSPHSASTSKVQSIAVQSPTRQGSATKAPNMSGTPFDRSVAKIRSGSFGFGKDIVELSINVADNLLFIYPNAAEDTEDIDAIGHRPRATFIVTITITIAEDIPPPPPIESLTVQLKGLESLGFPQGGLEQNVILYATKKVSEAQNLELLPGTAYRWDVPIEVNHDVAPYERMRYGRVFQKMSVQLHWSKRTSSSKMFSRYKDLSVDRDVWIATIPRVSNMLDYAQTHRTENEDLGPMVIHVRSHHLTVGSYLRLGLYIPQLNEKNVKILKMELSIKQYTTLHSRKRNGVVHQDAHPEVIPFLVVQGDEFDAELRPRLHSNWIARIPHCHRLRPSTLTGSTEAAIRVSHRIQVKISYEPEDSMSNKESSVSYVAQWPVTISSCTCRWRSLKLPSYDQIDVSPLPYEVHEIDSADLNAGITYRGRLQSHLDQNDCSCGISMEEILKFEDEYEQAQHTCLTELMSQELLTDSSRAPPAWEERSGQEDQPANESTVQGCAVVL